MKKKIKIINGLVVLPDGIKSASIEIEDGLIADISSRTKKMKSDTVIDAKGRYVLPGFIDIHTNGTAGFDLTNGIYDINTGKFISGEQAYINGLIKALRAYTRSGATRVVLTSLAAPVQQLIKVFGHINKFKNEYTSSGLQPVLEGLFIEGTFMKLPEYKGAHNPDYFNKPSIKLFDELQEAAGSLIKIVNIVPEWGDDALSLIKYLSKKNIVCAAGHTGAIGFQYQEALKSGLTLAVHFLNGPTGSSCKTLGNGGAVETILRSKEMFAEIIVDGYHVDKAYVMDIIKRKGFDKVCAITDSMFAVGIKKLKNFHMLGVDGTVSPDRKYLTVTGKKYNLFGSALTMDQAFANLLTWLTNSIEGIWNQVHPPLGFEEALVKTSALCSINPAKVLNIYEPGLRTGRFNSTVYTGSLEVGKSADLLIAGIKKLKHNYEIKIDNTFVKGQPQKKLARPVQ